jgi:hypothetical protein
MGEMRNAYKFFDGNLEGKDHMENLGVHRRIMLEWILEKWGGKLWTDWIHLTQNREQRRALVKTVMNQSIP